MKFSLKHLLAITLLLVLSINGINNWHRAKLVGLESEQLQVAIDTELKTTQFFKDKELVYTHAFDAFENRKAKLLGAPEEFDQVAAMHRKLDSRLVHIFAVPDGDRLSRVPGPETLRIRLPESPAFELCLGFHQTEASPRAVPSTMRDSYYFLPKEQFTFPLPVGDSIVKLSFPSAFVGEKDELKVEVNGVEVHTASRDSVLSFRDIISRESADLLFRFRSGKNPSFEPGPISLTTLNMWPTKHEPESLSLVIRPIKQAGNRD